MNIKKIEIDGEEVEVALKLDPEYYEQNIYFNDDTVELDSVNNSLNGEENE